MVSVITACFEQVINSHKCYVMLKLSLKNYTINNLKLYGACVWYLLYWIDFYKTALCVVLGSCTSAIGLPSY